MIEVLMAPHPSARGGEILPTLQPRCTAPTPPPLAHSCCAPKVSRHRGHVQQADGLPSRLLRAAPGRLRGGHAGPFHTALSCLGSGPRVGCSCVPFTRLGAQA
eukprot:14150638-Alexandrium_andersonii.AAC.1